VAGGVAGSGGRDRLGERRGGPERSAAGGDRPLGAHPFRSGLPDDVLLAAVLAGVGVSCSARRPVGLAVQTRRARGARRRQLAWFFVVVLVLLIGEASSSRS
jgi:hypothetical protein